LDVIEMGWNTAVYKLFKNIESNGFPFLSSDDETQMFASNLLYRLGCIHLLKRTAEMLKTGILLSQISENKYSFKRTEIANSQHIDFLELGYLNKIDEEIKNRKNKNYHGWDLTNHYDLDKILNKEGNYLSVGDKTFNRSLLIHDIENLMNPLVFQWSIKPTMIGYDTTEKIDWHFLTIASLLVNDWRDEAGIHPRILIDDITGAHLTSIMVLIVSFHLKHIVYVQIAKEKFNSISTHESSTIWCEYNQLMDDIVIFTGFEKFIVKKALGIITMKYEDINILENNSTKFKPLLIDIGNDFIIRPISSILINPFHAIFLILENRYPNFKHVVSEPREEWLRKKIYALFGGTRYQTIDGNVNLRINGKNITDIDAAIFDNTTGELALIQIKWQDFFTNDVKKLRSKASNLTKELDEWSEKVDNWILINGAFELAKSLRLKIKGGGKITKILLFGISKNIARTQGFGFKTKAEKLAICNWAQFQRNRFEIGPVNNVLSALFMKIKEQENIKANLKAMPVSFKIGEKIFYYEDLWSYNED
jgi:hypothetical protein